MRKKKGYALVVVLLSLMALVITGMAVYSYVANTSKLNKNERQKEMIETAAKSGLSIGQYYLINEKNFKYIKGSQEIDKDYIDEKVNSNNFADININEEERLDSYDYNIIITKEKNNTYTIKSKVSKGSLTAEKISKVSIS